MDGIYRVMDWDGLLTSKNKKLSVILPAKMEYSGIAENCNQGQATCTKAIGNSLSKRDEHFLLEERKFGRCCKQKVPSLGAGSVVALLG